MTLPAAGSPLGSGSSLRLGPPPHLGHDGQVSGIDPDATAATETTPSRRRRVDPALLLVSAIIAMGLVLVTRGFLVSVTGDERSDLPPTIESVTPVPDAEQALAQTNVFVDLAPGHTGVLVIDGEEIPTVNLSEVQASPVEPGEQVSVPPVTVFEPGNSTLTYTPSANGPVPRFEPGLHRVEVIHWRIDEGRQRARSFTWQFVVV